MISFETEKSSIYERNKTFCETAELNIKQLNSSFSGYCNSFGFELEGHIELNNLKIQLKLFKHQTTQNGIIIPKDAVDQSGTELHILGLNKSQYLKIGRSVLKRIITSTENKRILPKPYYISFNDKIDKNSLDHLANFIIHYKVAKLVLYNGSLHITLPYAINDANAFIYELLKLIGDIE